MADPLSVLGLVDTLLSIICKVKELFKNRSENVEVLRELAHFIDDLQLNIHSLQNKLNSSSCSSNGIADLVLDALRMDLASAKAEAKTILNEGFLRSLWDANKALAQLQRLHKRVITSFQTKLTIASFDVTIEIKESMSKVNAKLLERRSGSSNRRIQNIFREELHKALQPLRLVLEESNGGVEAAVSIRNTDPKPSVLEGPITWYEDPITWELMCDPVKGTNGYTYDRWTFLRRPSSGDVPTSCCIAVDDVSVRDRLFLEFPQQEERCIVKRVAYKNEALQEAHLGHLDEALIMLKNVLMWNPDDEECLSKRDAIQQQIDSLSETSQQGTSSGSHASVNRQRVLEDSNYGLEEPSCVEAHLSTDKLTAAYLTYDLANVPKHVLLHANLPCPSDCHPFYYFEMIVEPPVVSYGDNPNRTHVAIGFSCTKAVDESSHHIEQLPKLGMYPGSCGYYSLNGEIFYYDKEKRQVVSIESEAFQAGDTVGAGFHSGTGNVFFTRCGQVVTVVKAAIFEHPIDTIFPTVGLQSYGAQVKLNFSPYKFLNEPYPARLDRMTCNENHLFLSPRGLSLKIKEKNGTFRAILADKPVPMRTTLVYFEVCSKKIPISRHGNVALGFTGTDGFQQEGSPGDWKNSCGYQSDREKSLILVSQEIRLESRTSLHCIGGLHDAHMHDRIGAGIHYDSNEIFFVKNGLFIGAVSNTLTGKLMPAIAVRNKYKMEVKFGSHGNTCLEMCKPSGFKCSSRLQKLGLTAFQRDKLRFKKYQGSRSESGIIAFQADNVAPFHEEDFYFEITVNNSGKCGNITIGFCHHSHFRDDMQPGGYPHSCGYHGVTGKIFTGSETGQQYSGPTVTFSEGDTVGAGISFNTNMIFFVKNGKVIESIPNQMMSCALYPVVSLGSVGEEVHFNFGK